VDESKKQTKDTERNLTVVNWLFVQTTHVVAAPYGFACVNTSGKQLYILSFIKIHLRVSEPRGVELCPLSLTWPVARACISIQAVIA